MSFFLRRVKTVEELESEIELPKYLEKDELNRFLSLANVKGLDLDQWCFEILAYTGIRAGELVCLKWSDVNFNEHKLNITKTCYNPNNRIKDYSLHPPKNGKKRERLLLMSLFATL